MKNNTIKNKGFPLPAASDVRMGKCAGTAGAYSERCGSRRFKRTVARSQRSGGKECLPVR